MAPLRSLPLQSWERRPIPPAEDIVPAAGAVGHGLPLIYTNEFTALPTTEVAAVVDFFTGSYGHDCLLLWCIFNHLLRCCPLSEGYHLGRQFQTLGKGKVWT